MISVHITCADTQTIIDISYRTPKKTSINSHLPKQTCLIESKNEMILPLNKPTLWSWDKENKKPCMDVHEMTSDYKLHDRYYHQQYYLPPGSDFISALRMMYLQSQINTFRIL